MENEVAVVQQHQMAGMIEWVSPQQVVAQVKHVQDIMKSVMREGEHYGKIPGTKKQCLFKSGAEILGLTFRLIPEFDVAQKDFGNGHREITVTCRLRNPAGSLVGQGVGSCSTMESKYRWRSGADLEDTGKPIPKEYWDAKKDNPAKAQAIIGGKGFVAKKNDLDAWTIHAKSVGDRSENPDIADVWNTVLKMAKKRAHVDATITATATSDMFTQDVEDLPNFGVQEGTRPADRDAGPEVVLTAEQQAEIAEILADIYTAGKPLPEESHARIQADIEAAGNDLDALAAILEVVRESVERRDLEAKALTGVSESERPALRKWLDGNANGKPPLQKIRDLIAKQPKPTTKPTQDQEDRSNDARGYTGSPDQN